MEERKPIEARSIEEPMEAVKERDLTYFVADAHLGLDVLDPQDREDRFVAFLRSVDTERTDALYLLGDIFDFWYEYHDVVPKGYARVFAALQDMMAAGVKVYFFQGNHDVWTYHYFEDMGMVRLTQPAVVTIGGRTFCLGHGDGLGPAPTSYRILRWIFHNRVLQFLFSTLHPRIAFWLGNTWSRHNRRRHFRRGAYVFKGEEEPLYKFAVDFSKQQHVDYFIFGHFHAKVDLTLPTGARLFVLKDWFDSNDRLVFRAGDPCCGI